MYGFLYELKKDWPPLSWLAVCERGKSEIIVHHGRGVETHPEWFCEAVWDGDFKAGDFDLTDLVFGSGGRARAEQTAFVSSGSTVDRLQHIRHGGKTLISNSLACLYANSAGWDVKGYSGFSKFFGSIVKGLDECERTVPVDGADLTYFSNVIWNGASLTVSDKPAPERDFSCFDAYHIFLQTALTRIGSNTRDQRRNWRLDLLGTVSTGYDSPTIAVLARNAGLEEVLSFVTDRRGRRDDGSEIAARIGLRIKTLDRLAWKSRSKPEIPFIAADAKGEDIQFAGAEDDLRGRVLLTGYHGDKVWEKTNNALQSTIVRGDRSGLSLTEYRLLIGMIHLPVPFMGIRDISQINRISNSSEMLPWDLNNDYNRPICRRILEQAGIPRQLFGQQKKAASNLFSAGDECLTRGARLDYHRWHKSSANDLASTASREDILGSFVSRSLVPELWSSIEPLTRVLLAGLPRRFREAMDWRLHQVRRRVNSSANHFFPSAFPWALQRLASRYGSDR